MDAYTILRKAEPVLRKMRNASQLILGAFRHWGRVNGSFLAAGISYYVIFSLIPFLLPALAIARAIFGETAEQGIILRELGQVLGRPAAQALQQIIAGARGSFMGAATFFGSVMLLYGASRLFAHVQIALDIIWDARSAPEWGGFKKAIYRIALKRLVSFSLVIGVGLTLILLFAVDSILDLMRGSLAAKIPFLEHVLIWKTINFSGSLFLLAAITAAVYRFLPDTEVQWKDVWAGAMVASFLLGLGPLTLNLYLRFVSQQSVPGMVGSLLVFLIGIHLSAQVFVFGAVFTHSYAHRSGSRSGGRFKDRRKQTESAPKQASLV